MTKPTICRSVIYSDPYLEQDIAAIITRVYPLAQGQAQAQDGMNAVTLLALSPMQMPLPVDHVKYSEHQQWGCWRWPERV